jgi:hypothetical protein
MRPRARARARVRARVCVPRLLGRLRRLSGCEKSFRTAKSDLQARPVYHRKRDSIEAHLTSVFAALAVSRWIEHRTGWSIRNIRHDRPPLPHHPEAGRAHAITAAAPSPDDLRQALEAINATR